VAGGAFGVEQRLALGRQLIVHLVAQHDRLGHRSDAVFELEGREVAGAGGGGASSARPGRLAAAAGHQGGRDQGREDTKAAVHAGGSPVHGLASLGEATKPRQQWHLGATPAEDSEDTGGSNLNAK